MNAKPISEQKGFSLDALDKAQGCSKFVGVGLGVFFMLSGIGILIFLAILSRGWYVTQSWPSAECEILTSQIKRNASSDGASFSPKFTYEYEVEGQKFVGTRYFPIEFSSSRSWANKTIKNNPIGSKQTCYYNPKEPRDAILNREFSWLVLLIPLLPLVFIAIGVGVAISSLRQKSLTAGSSKAGPKRSSDLPGYATSFGAKAKSLASPSEIAKKTASRSELAMLADEEDVVWDGPRQLKPSQTRWVTVLTIGFFALFWNGVVSVFVFQMFAEPDWFIILFLTPFVLIGLALFGFLSYSILQLFNPKVEIALSSGAVPLGGTVDLAWEVTGRISSIKNLKIEIIGEESATYRRGTDTITDEQVFEKIPVCEAITLDEIQFGSAKVQVPASAMHSFDVGNNKIEWRI